MMTLDSQDAVQTELFGYASVDEFIREHIEELACATGESVQEWINAHGGRWA